MGCAQGVGGPWAAWLRVVATVVGEGPKYQAKRLEHEPHLMRCLDWEPHQRHEKHEAMRC